MACTNCSQPAPAELMAAITGIHTYLFRLEQAMTSAAEGITGLGAKFDAVAAIAADIQSDFAAFREAMEAQRGQLDAEGRAALDQANERADAAVERLRELDVSVGDADGSDTPPPPTEPTEPAEPTG